MMTFIIAGMVFVGVMVLAAYNEPEPVVIERTEVIDNGDGTEDVITHRTELYY